MKLISKIRAYCKRKREEQMVELLESLEWPSQTQKDEQIVFGNKIWNKRTGEIRNLEQER